MSLKLKTHVTNQAEISRDLSQFKLALRNKIMRGAMNVVTRDVAKVAKATARGVSTRTRQLWRSVGSKVVTYKKNAITMGIVGPRRGMRKFISYAEAYRLSGKRQRRQAKKLGENLEKLTVKKPVYLGPKVLVIDPSRYAHLVEKKKPFLIPTLERTKTQTVRTLGDELKRRIAIEAKRAATK